MVDPEKLAEAVKTFIEAIKELADPFAWANRFKESSQKYKKDSELRELAEDCRELSTALYRLEISPSSFLYNLAHGKPLHELTDEELGNEDMLKNFATEIGRFKEVFDAVLKALKPVEECAYLRMGEVIKELRKDLKERRRLLDELEAIVIRPGKPEEIRAIGFAYEQLIEAIQPIRESIRSFVDEHS